MGKRSTINTDLVIIMNSGSQQSRGHWIGESHPWEIVMELSFCWLSNNNNQKLDQHQRFPFFLS